MERLPRSDNANYVVGGIADAAQGCDFRPRAGNKKGAGAGPFFRNVRKTIFSAFGELEGTPGLRLAVLLALDHARIAG
jgi:hypothetical protein